MNDAHIHLLVNHFPIIGTVFGALILIGGIFLKNNTIKNVAYFLFILSAIFTLVSMITGEGAEEVAEHIEGVAEEIIETHEELAEKFALLMYALGFASLIGVYAHIKNHAKAVLLSYVILAMSLGGIAVSVKVGNTGGEIRHTEIRKDYVREKISETSESGEQE